jgi:peptidoglycan-associated lipoprotein
MLQWSYLNKRRTVMKMSAAGVVLIGGCMLMLAGGCAKHEMVKKDEGITPAASPAVKTPVKPDVVKAQPIKKDAISQSSTKDSASMSSARASQLQNALQKIYFDFDSYKLSDAARTTMVKNAESMKKDPADKVRIEGNCDERGSDEYNLALGERRAKSAMEYLVSLGIHAERLSFISYGKEKPAEPGHDEAAWAKNRRDDFTVVSK